MRPAISRSLSVVSLLLVSACGEPPTKGPDEHVPEAPGQAVPVAASPVALTPLGPPLFLNVTSRNVELSSPSDDAPTAKSTLRFVPGSARFGLVHGVSASPFVPVEQGTVWVTAAHPLGARARWVGHFDLSGEGFEADVPVKHEPSVSLAPGEVVRLAIGNDLRQKRARAALLWLELSDQQEAGAILLSGCPATGNPALAANATSALPFDASGPTSGLVSLLATDGLCVEATSQVTLVAKRLGVFRRYGGLPWTQVEPAIALDTERGVGGWQGALGVEQTIDLKLGDMLPAGATTLWARLVSPDAPEPSVLRIGGCDGADQMLTLHAATARAGVTVPLAPSSDGRLCISASARAHVQLQVVGHSAPAPDGPVRCEQLPPPAAPACEATDIEGRLRCVPGLRVSRSANGVPGAPFGAQVFELSFEQPEDHGDPFSRTFEQRVKLVHVGFDAPVVLLTTGYSLGAYSSELNGLMASNQVEPEHRFFSSSRAEPANWDHATIEQAAKDSHRLVEALQWIYRGKWVNTGHSKGGMTAVFHRRFFPCDVTASVPYVTPISYSMEDPRYAQFAATIGGEKYRSCREGFWSIGREVVQRENEFAPSMSGSYATVGGKGNALRRGAMGFDWGFWQFYDPSHPDDGCPAYEAVMNNPSSREQLVRRTAAGALAYSDEYLGYYHGLKHDMVVYMFQAAFQLGTQGFYVEHLKDLGPLPTEHMEPYYLLPELRRAFDAEAMPDVQRWLANHGERFLFLYGAYDPWTGGAFDLGGGGRDLGDIAFELGDAKDSVKLMVEEGNHGAALSDLSAPSRAQALDLLHRWLGVPIPVSLTPVPRGELTLYRDVMRRLAESDPKVGSWARP